MNIYLNIVLQAKMEWGASGVCMIVSELMVVLWDEIFGGVDRVGSLKPQVVGSIS